MNSLSIVIPVYNGALSIRALVEELLQTLPTLTTNYEIILVEDDGRDHSWEVIQGVVQDYGADVRAFKLMRNFGQHAALLCGIRAAQYDIIVTMDDDLQHPPAEIEKLLAKLTEGYDVVYGKPAAEQHGFLRDMASQVTKLALQNAMGADTARSISAFRAIRTPVREAFLDYASPFVNIDVLLTWGTTRFTAIPVRHEPRKLGVSNYTIRKLITHSFNMITGFSTLPLQIASLTGFAMTFFGIVILFYVVGRYVLEGGTAFPGFPFLASVIAIFSGTQMFMIGIIGEYLARMHFRTMGKPAYIVREDTHQRETA
ncbi:MAG: glycosyltransferase family 2 protein [Anaerolineae bacterium]|nr:glycosyltransferase family 2 protein [Anaerolineae bacterium]